MKYYQDPITGLDWHCDEIFNWVAVDNNSSLRLYEYEPQRIPEIIGESFKECGGIWISVYRSFDCIVIQRDIYYPDWGNSLRKLTK